MTREPTEMEMRVAKAICAARAVDPDGDWRIHRGIVMEVAVNEPAERHWQIALLDARAAIRAMLFATPEMMDAGYKEIRIGLPDAWLAIIDAASPEEM